MKGRNKSGLYFSLVSIFCLAILIFMIKHPEVISESASEGIDLCISTLIPTMFPFFIVSSFLLRSSALFYIGTKADRVAQKVFGVSGDALSVFLISLISGFPVGANLVSKMLEEKTLSKNEGARLMTCCVNAGPAFVVGVVGTTLLKSEKAGIILLSSLSISATAVFFVTRFLMKEKDCQKEKIKSTNKKPDFSLSLVKGVSESTSSMASVCGWIIVFSCVKAVLLEKSDVFLMLLEVTFGCKKAIEFPLPVMALVIGWGGLCVHCQVFGAVIKSEIGKIKFFFFRMLNGALSAGICSVLIKVFPCTIQTFGSVSQSVNVNLSSNAATCAGLLIMCAILIVDFEESRNRKNNTR